MYVRNTWSKLKYFYFELYFVCKSFVFQTLLQLLKFEVRNSRVTKSSYETVLRKMASHFELHLEIFYN